MNIIIFLLIVGMAIAIKIGFRPSQLNMSNVKLKWPWIVAGLVVFLLLFVYKGYSDKKEQAKVDKKGMKNVLVCKDEETEKWVKIPPGFYKEAGSGECVEGTPPPPRMTEEALKLKYERLTPFSGYIGWNYVVRTDGDPIRIKPNGCEGWFDHPGKGLAKAPKCFKPGEAEFVSSEKENPVIGVQVYEKVTVQ